MDLTQLLAENLFVMHGFMAGMTGNPIWGLEKSEADELGEAINNVARHYDIPGVSQITVDYIRLARVAGTVYGTRLFAARMTHSVAKPAPAPTAPKASPEQSAAVNMGETRPEDYMPQWREVSPGPGLPTVKVFQ